MTALVEVDDVVAPGLKADEQLGGGMLVGDFCEDVIEFPLEPEPGVDGVGLIYEPLVLLNSITNCFRSERNSSIVTFRRFI